MATGAADREERKVNLDDRNTWSGLDPGKMLDFAVGFPDQVREAARVGGSFTPPAQFADPRLVVLSGMGGSAVAGDFLARLCEARSPAPFLVNRGYAIPASVGRDTLFIASSHSGNTEETLEAAEAALGCRARILCATTDGRLQAWAREHEAEGVALLVIPGIGMPPRASLGYSLIPLALALERLGVYPGASAELAETIPLLERLRDRVHPDVPGERNQAKKLAEALFGRIPWVQGTVGIMSAVAYRWRTQFNENSKVLAYSSEYPELDHNEVIGWERAERWRELVSVIILRSPSDHRRVLARVDITRAKFIEPKAPVHVIEAEGDSPLAQLLWTVYLGDFASIYLAFLNGADPASIASINTLKHEMAQLPK